MVKSEMELIVNGKTHKIKTVSHHKQSKAYDDAVESGDFAMAALLYEPPTLIAQYIIEFRIRTILLEEKLQAK
jgi:hypothetical protein